MTHPKRVLILALLAGCLAAYFMVVSRYPALNEKAIMARAGSVSDTLTSKPLYKFNPSDSYLRKSTLTTLNWIWENRKGMLFGVLFGALMLTLFGYFKTVRTTNSYLNTLYGFVLGAPLGVCVNCAAPVFKGVLRTRRIETAFATMLSSPTMNIIVLTMVFSLFPFYMAATKVGFALVMIFLVVPSLSRMLGRDHKIKDWQKLDAHVEHTHHERSTSAKTEGWGAALVWALRDFVGRFFYMVVTTVPLMFVAGAAGAFLSHLLPPVTAGHSVSIPGILLLTAVGTILPVPMAFDVILSNALMTMGLAPAYVLVLLCTLGIFSVYSFMIVWTSASKTWALSLAACVMLLATLVGVKGTWLHENLYLRPNLEVYAANRTTDLPPAQEVASLPFVAPSALSPLQFTAHTTAEGLQLESSPFRVQEGSSATPFQKMEGHEIGLSRGFRYGIRDYPDPFWIGRGTAAGDFDKDGWDDIAFGSDEGPLVYRNRGGWFEPLPINNAALNANRVYAVAFVDLNGDTWLDLFVTTYRKGNFLLINVQGQFDFSHPLPVPNNGALLTISPAFGDLDRNGTLDIVNGNMALGVITGFRELEQGRSNSIVYSAPPAPAGSIAFREVKLSGLSGETMSTLVSDINNDQLLDIYFANDFVVPDQLLLGTTRNDTPFYPVRGDQHMLGPTPIFSMSTDSGDLNNDGQLDLLISGTTDQPATVGQAPIDGVPPERYREEKWDVKTCDGIRDPLWREHCRRVRETDYLLTYRGRNALTVSDCLGISDPYEKQGCLLAIMWLITTTNDSEADAFGPCTQHAEGDDLLTQTCEILGQRGRQFTTGDFPESLAQEDNNFVYLFDPVTKAFRDVNSAGQERFTHPGGWTWNTKIADLDNDEWQDIFTAEGAIRKHDYGWNTFMKNNAGQRFDPRQFSFGLTDDFNLLTYALIDFDGDGDLDIIGNSSTGPIQVYENFSTSGHRSIAIDLRDETGNHYGLGARVTISYAHGSKTQVREIKGGGGYQSFDPPIAYFGLGTSDTVDGLSVRWVDGAETHVKGPFAAGQRYRLSRRGPTRSERK